MARPRKEGMDYYPHDTDASGDEKIEAMRALFGNDGYAFYFILCERIYRTSNAELDISKAVLLTPVVKKLLTTHERFNEMLEAAFELDLFDPIAHSQRKVITSNGIKKRFKEVTQMRSKWRSNKEKAEENSDPDEFSNGFSSEKTGEETGESKAKQSKANENINNATTTGDEFKKVFDAYCDIHQKSEGQAYGQAIDMQRLIDMGIPSETIISVMRERYSYKKSRGESVEGFIYYKKPIIEAWEGGKRLAEYGGSAKGFQPRGNTTPSASESITGGQLGWIGKNRGNVVPLPNVQG